MHIVLFRLILMVVLPLLQFCSKKAFGDYAARSEVIDILCCLMQ